MKTYRWIVTAVAVGMFGAVGFGAGDLSPSAPPGPSMHSLEEIYQQLLTTQQQVADMQQRMVVAGSMQTTSGDMVLIPAGSFSMGATTNVGHEIIADAVPQHTVAVDAFYIDRYEVTKAKWDTVWTWATNHGYAFDNAGSGKATNHPVQTVNWYDCLKWCNARSAMDGFAPCYTNASGTVYTNGTFAGGCNWSAGGYRLPTEAEWEKAARGGVAGRRFPWNDANTIQHARANYNAAPGSYSYDTSPTTGYHPSYDTGGTPYTSPAGAFAAKGYGLYDMAGNVWEWCWDAYGDSYYASSPGSNPTGPASGTSRVLRGGAWSDCANYSRCASRLSYYSGSEWYSVGFRCVRGL